ncbi:MAG: MerR family DNA-binding protein [Gammaproteobacteria bacterium]|nr:MerR family DNA-binding protein [Gammaproteobacteria bacterium]
MDSAKSLTIGKLADRSGVNIETIRYYQRLCLIQEPPKPAQGFRQYPVADIARVLFIRRAQQLGFTLKEIGELLELGDGHCQEVQQLARLKVEKIEERLRDLQSMHAALLDLLSQCEVADRGDIHCALIEALGTEATIRPSETL